MMKSLLCFLIVVFFLAQSFGQQADQDTLSIKKLEDVVVRGYEQNRRLNETAGAVGLVNQRQFEKYGTVSVLPAINAVPVFAWKSVPPEVTG
jgi:iron complex outermembrane receptor protein